eukprot:CAMPEP_0113565776 /NCGR_PEP_ID=MMETSP0015_2-20120614/22365_1 /TAXON_ID=2838 /ORGANISM="Odontella" /LENGTH=385 /DNA_ID=CAMNT_0000468011 /DNA_START=285 /DNA_END=1442 /DNA_ORIENTATION=- /assembly_acc=CAM_ASM_000160
MDRLPLGLRLRSSFGTGTDASETPNSMSDLIPTQRDQCDKNRRLFLCRVLQATSTISVAVTALPSRSEAGEVGARITRAVTQSDLGVSVRRSVVQGAQVMDKMDGRWEKFSDNFGLGAERSRREGRPKPRDVPDLLPLDAAAARSILKVSDDTFLSIVPLTEQELTSRVAKVDSLVRKSFERSGLSIDESIMNADTYNYLSYIHFKAFCDILVDKNINFNQFRKNFESQLGDKLLSILDPDSANRDDGKRETGPDALRQKLRVALGSVDDLAHSLQSKGMVALVERSNPDDESVTDWSEDLSDLQFSVTLDIDVTQNAQILLQEQGYRLFPNYARFAIAATLKRKLSPMRQEVITDEYYMDTSYSSDPDLFEVKQVLLNIVVESA